MANFKVKTGNLSESVVASVVSHANRTEFAKHIESNKPDDGCRFCYVGYKLTDKAKADAEKNGTELPQNYSVQVPVLFDDIATMIHDDRTNGFIRAICEDYQDRKLHDVADKRAEFDACNLGELIADYYDNSRNRDGYTQAVVLKWFDVTFGPAFSARKQEQNAEIKESKGKIKGKIYSDAEIATVVANYKPFFKALVKIEAGYDPVVLKNVRTTLQRLIETSHLDSDDAIALFFIEQCNKAEASIQSIIDTGL